MKFGKILSAIIALFALVAIYQNCGQTDTGNSWYKSCSGFLCADTGIGDARQMNISLTSSATDLIIPYTGTPPYRVKVSGTCNDGGFRRNKIEVALREKLSSFVSETDCENAESFPVVKTKCVDGHFIGDVEVTSATSLCSPATKTQVLELQVTLTGIDNFDNEYTPSRGQLSSDIPVRQSIRPPTLNSFADGGAENFWLGTRVFATSTESIQINDLFGYCTYSSVGPANNKIRVLIRPYGTVERLEFKDVTVECRPLNPADGVIYQRGQQLGFTGVFGYLNPIVLSYLQAAAWPGLTEADAQVNSRNFVLYLVQKDPGISSTYEIENPHNVTLKFNSMNSSQGWTADIMRQAQKQTLRAINMSWDDATVTNNDLAPILGTGGAMPYRFWILQRMQLQEDASFRVFSPNGPSVPFLDRIGKIAYGSKRCDTRLTMDMGRSGTDTTTQALSGSTGTNTFDSTTVQQQRLALCSWYWIDHGLLDINAADIGNWRNTWMSKFIEQGVRFNGSATSCVSASSSTPGDANACQTIWNFFNSINTYKARYLGPNQNIYGGTGSAYRDQQSDFNYAYAQLYLNQIMGWVSANLVMTGTIATSANTFLDNVIKNTYETATNPTRLYGSTTESLEKRKQLYPVELNLSGATAPFQAYTTKTANGSTDANGSQNKPANY